MLVCLHFVYFFGGKTLLFYNFQEISELKTKLQMTGINEETQSMEKNEEK